VIEKYKKLKPDVVIMDITMPRMDGLNALKAIKQVDPEARVIVCSALGQQRLIIDAIKMGAKDFIVKPFEPDRLTAAIQKALK
jgi:two-component system chemotaxis response regulator CheY